MIKIPQDMLKGTEHDTNRCGRVSILEYQSKLKVEVLFMNTGTRLVTSSKSIRSGSLKDKFSPSVYGVGFIGEGKYTSSKKGGSLKAYTTWAGMLERCYSENLRSHNPTYEGCLVCSEWHNFQRFAKWFDRNYVDGYHLDKDIKVEGNKVYSPETCLFVPQSENSSKAKAKNYTLTSPDGDKVNIYNLTDFCKKNGLDYKNVWKVMNGKAMHCKGWTV